MVDDKASEDGVTKAGRLIAVTRDALLLCLLIVAIYFGIQSLPLIETAIKHSSIESVNLGAIVLKLRDDPVANYPSQGITVDAVGGSAEILEKGSGDLLRGIEASQSPRIELLGLSAGHTYRTHVPRRSAACLYYPPVAAICPVAQRRPSRCMG